MRKIFIAGHQGLVGSAFNRKLSKCSYEIITRTKAELDLTNTAAVKDFFKQEKPDWVILAAAKVGGIHSNNVYPVDFLLTNLKIQNNVIESAHEANVSKLLFLGSSCIYPREVPQPIKEEYLLSGKLEPTNGAYAIAKIAGLELCKAYNKQHNTNFISVMPANLYGSNDNYHSENAHALPMLMRRFHEAKINEFKDVTVWGDGTPRREFLFSDDLAEAGIMLLEKYSAKDIGPFINIGTGVDCTIAELAKMIQEVVGFQGDIKFDTSRPNGSMLKRLDVGFINKLGWKATTEVFEGLKKTYSDFTSNPKIRMDEACIR